jgi:hypothetical protein
VAQTTQRDLGFEPADAEREQSRDTGQTRYYLIERMRSQHAWKPSDQPSWLTPELFTQKIQLLLAGVPMSAIRSLIGVSKLYASKIRQGYRPHPRHSQALAKLAGISGSASN